MSQGGVLSFESTPVLAAQYTTDSGVAIPAANNLNVFGGLNIDTSGAGDTITIATSADPTFNTVDITTSGFNLLDLTSTNAAFIGPHIRMVNVSGETATINTIGLLAADAHRQGAIEYRPTTGGRHNFYDGVGVADADITLTLLSDKSAQFRGIITQGTWQATDVEVAYGGTGASSFNAYEPICGGTTTTNPLQSVGTGTIDFVLVHNGPGALPSWKDISGIGVSSIQGTANQVLVNGTSGSPVVGDVILTTPQDIATSSAPTFLNDSGNLTITLGSTSDATTDTKAISLISNGFANLNMVGDAANTGGEPGGARIRLGQDGNPGGIYGRIGIVQAAGADGSSGGTLTGTTTNSFYFCGSSTTHLGGSDTITTTLTSTSTTSTVPIYVPAATGLTPQYSFTGDTNTGIGQASGDTMSFISGGTLKFTVGATSVEVTAVQFLTNGQSAFINGNSGSLASSFGLGYNVYGGSTGVIFAGASNISFCYAPTSLNTGYVNTFLGDMYMSGQFLADSGTATDPVYLVGNSTSTSTGVFSPGVNTIAVSVGGVKTLETASVTDTAIINPGPFTRTQFTVNGTTGVGVIVEAGATTAGTNNNGMRVYLAEGTNSGVSLAYNGGAAGDVLDLPANTGVLVVHNSSVNGQNRITFPRLSNRVGINTDAPAQVLHITDVSSTTARIQLDQSAGVASYIANTTGYMFFEVNGGANAMSFNHADTYIGIGSTSSGTAAMRLHMANTTSETVGNSFWLQNTSSGFTTYSTSSHAFWFTSGTMNATNKSTPGIIFGSTDSAFTTQNPKFLAGIFGEAIETYSADTDSGMDLVFLTSAINAGVSSTAFVTYRVSSENGCMAANFFSVGIPASYEFLTVPISCTWFLIDTSTTSQSMNWAVDAPASNEMIRYRVVFPCVATYISVGRDNTAGSGSYTFTVGNSTSGLNQTVVIAFSNAAGGTSYYGAISGGVAFAAGDQMFVNCQVSSGVSDTAEVALIVYGYQVPP